MDKLLERVQKWIQENPRSTAALIIALVILSLPSITLTITGIANIHHSNTAGTFQENLILEYDFESRNQTHVKDISGNTNHGKIEGNVNFSKGYAHLSGPESYIRLPDIFKETGYEDITISFRFKGDSNFSRLLFNRYKFSKNAGLGTGIDEKERLYLNFGKGKNSETIRTDESLIRGKENFGAIALSNEKAKIYLNDDKASIDKNGTIELYKYVYLGRDGRGLADSKGKISNIKIYDQKLSDNKIASLYNGIPSGLVFKNTFDNVIILSIIAVVTIIEIGRREKNE
jgi:hypothetical protein